MEANAAALAPGTIDVKMEAPSAYRRLAARRRHRTLLISAAIVLALLLTVAAAIVYRARSVPATPAPEAAATQQLPKALAQPQAFRPLTVEQAQDANAGLPFTTRADTPASKFVLTADSENRGRAIDCLAQAVYYEAASEGEAGQRAVAQVVLNRMRHPAYPASVCGVVYQGSERVMGCQFTFTCDGSLLRRPNAGLYAEAKAIAIQALAGRVYAPVGHSTNYHADYVLPYWASSLDKQVQIGRHIFYRLKGGLGSSSAFRQRYAGRELVVVPQSTILLTAEALAQSDEVVVGEEPDPTPNDGSSNPIIVADAIIREPLVADERSGGLIADNGATVTPRKKKQATTDCAAKGSIRLVPTAPADMRSGAESAC